MRTHHISITTNVYGTHLFGVFAYKESSTIKVLSDILLICKNCTYNKKLVWSSFWCWIPHLQFFSFTSLIVPTLFPLSHCCHHYHIVTLPYHCNIIVVVKSLLQHCRNIVPKKTVIYLNHKVSANILIRIFSPKEWLILLLQAVLYKISPIDS